SLLLAGTPTPFLASCPPSRSLRYTAFCGLFITGRYPPTPFLASGPPSRSLRYTAFGGLFITGRYPHALLSVGPTVQIASVHRLRRPLYYWPVPPRLS